MIKNCAHSWAGPLWVIIGSSISRGRIRLAITLPIMKMVEYITICFKSPCFENPRFCSQVAITSSSSFENPQLSSPKVATISVMTQRQAQRKTQRLESSMFPLMHDNVSRLLNVDSLHFTFHDFDNDATIPV